MSHSFATGSRVEGDATSRSFGRKGTVTRVIDADGARGGLVEVRWDGEKRPSRSAGFEFAEALRPATDCAGCAICDPAEAARDEASFEAAFAEAAS